MTLDDEVKQFVSWGANLGIPMNKMPDQNAIRSMLKNSREGTFFFNLMQKIRPYQEVEIVRKNILLSKMDKLKDQLIPLSQRQFAPQELQRYLKMEDLLKEKSEIEAKLEEPKKRCELMLNAIKMKNIEKIKLIQKRDNLKSKVTILQLKSESLSAKKQTELDNQKKILSIMPVKFKAFTSQEANANKAVLQALMDLDEFYKISLTNPTNPNNILEAKTELWKKLRSHFSNIPNSVVWNIIVKMKEEQIQRLKDLNNASSDRSISFKTHDLTGFDVQLLKTKASIISLVSKYTNLLHDKQELENNFTTVSNSFVAAIREKLKMYAGITESDEVEELISDFVFQYSTHIHAKVKNDILTSEIENYKALSENGRRDLEGHSVAITSLKQIYSDTEALVQRVQQEISQFNDIKDKIRYSKGLLQRMLKDIKSSKQQNSGESFNLEGALTSTKLDFDSSGALNSTFRSENATVIGNIGFGISATILNELNLFNETPIENFKTLFKSGAFHLRANPIILESSEVATLQFCPRPLLTAHGSLQFIKNQIEWYAKMKKLSNELEPNVQIEQINFDELKLGYKNQYEEVTEMLDKIKICGIKTNRILSKSIKYYEFILSNCLKDFIPNNKLYLNQSFADYEAEYTMYYRMATVGSMGKN